MAEHISMASLICNFFSFYVCPCFSILHLSVQIILFFNQVMFMLENTFMLEIFFFLYSLKNIQHNHIKIKLKVYVNWSEIGLLATLIAISARRSVKGGRFWRQEWHYRTEITKDRHYRKSGKNNKKSEWALFRVDA